MAFYPIRRARLSAPFGEGIDWNNEIGRRVDWWWTPAKSLGSFTKSVGKAGILADPANGQALGKAEVCLGNTFSIFLLLACPYANMDSDRVLSVEAGEAFNLDIATTASAINATWRANWSSAGQTAQCDGSGVFDTRLIALVSDWNGSGQTSWWKREDQPEVTWTDAWGYAAPSDTTVYLGSNSTASTHIYGAFILRGNLGPTAARKLIADPWQVFV